jgi:hypothetical protein
MKKIVLSLVVLSFLSLAAVYVFIPSKLNISGSVQIDCTIDGGFRKLSAIEQWNSWWPFAANQSKIEHSDSVFFFNSDTFHISKISHNSLDLDIMYPGAFLPSQINLIPLPGNHIAVQWSTSILSSANPFKRYQLYRQAVSIKNNMDSILRNLQQYLSKRENVYGLPFREESTKDSILLTFKTETNSYPTTSYVYTIINHLKKASIEKGAVVTGFPMLNITTLTGTSYKVMVALPINKDLNNIKGFFISRLVPGKFITAEVKGGEVAVNETLKNIQYYFADYKRTTMAIPFQYLVTDRITEPDSTKWLTKIYAPVY